jgi:DnaJ-class molecular chaperone
MFAAIGNAAAILTDPEKRKQYDMYGSEEERIQQSQRHTHGGYHEYNYTRGFEGNTHGNITKTSFFSVSCFGTVIMANQLT